MAFGLLPAKVEQGPSFLPSHLAPCFLAIPGSQAQPVEEQASPRTDNAIHVFQRKCLCFYCMAVSHLFKDSKLYFKSSTNSSLYNRLEHLIRNRSTLLIACNIIMAFFFHYPNIVANLSCKVSCAVHDKSSVTIYKLDN